MGIESAGAPPSGPRSKDSNLTLVELAPRGQSVFKKCDNTLLLAEAMKLGPADLKQIEIAGIPLQEAIFSFAPSTA